MFNFKLLRTLYKTLFKGFYIYNNQIAKVCSFHFKTLEIFTKLYDGGPISMYAPHLT